MEELVLKFGGRSLDAGGEGLGEGGRDLILSDGDKVIPWIRAREPVVEVLNPSEDPAMALEKKGKRQPTVSFERKETKPRDRRKRPTLISSSFILFSGFFSSIPCSRSASSLASQLAPSFGYLPPVSNLSFPANSGTS